MVQEAYLVLENGKIFRGYRFGAQKDITGEVVFTTAMTGYVETLTDPSYYGQIVLQTFPLMGNYGMISADFESRQPKLSGYLVREWCQEPSNFRCEGTLDSFLKKNGIPGIYGIDTRALARTIREAGVMNGRICTDAEINKTQLLREISAFRVKNAISSVTRNKIEYYKAKKENKRVVLWDFGAKNGIIRSLNERGCTVAAVPAGTSADEILALKPDGIMLSNGPGDPADNLGIVAELKKLCREKIPLFGICLGHQLLALAMGGKTEKLHYGHRGANHPVQDIESGRIYMTSQNHGYTVSANRLPDRARIRFINGNDQTVEGIDYDNMPAFSVQFHPEACGGPLDTQFLFDRFIDLMKL